MATGRGSLSNDAELSNSKFVSAFKVEYDRLWKAKAWEIKALEKGYIFWAHPVEGVYIPCNICLITCINYATHQMVIMKGNRTILIIFK